MAGIVMRAIRALVERWRVPRDFSAADTAEFVSKWDHKVHEGMDRATFDAIHAEIVAGGRFTGPQSEAAERIVNRWLVCGLLQGWIPRVQEEPPLELDVNPVNPQECRIRTHKGKEVRIGEAGSSMSQAQAQLLLAERAVKHQAILVSISNPKLDQEGVRQHLQDYINSLSGAVRDQVLSKVDLDELAKDGMSRRTPHCVDAECT